VFPKYQRILVTGGAGFIGSHFVDRISNTGKNITVLDNVTTGNISNLNLSESKISFINGDIRDKNLMAELVAESDLVVHLAAALGVSNIMNNTLESISINIEGSETVLKAAAALKKRVIIASTSEVYGKNPIQPLTEESDRVIGAPQTIRWTYSDAKAIEESIARVLFITESLPVTTIRFFNTVGPRQTGKYGMVLPRLIESSLKNRDLEVYGNGEQTRVFCHVRDAVDGMISLIEDERSIGDVFNVGGVGEISITDLAEKIIKKTDSKSRIIYKPYSEVYPAGFEDMLRRVPDVTKIRNLTGWSPAANLEQIIDDTVRSLTINKNV